MVTSKLPRTGSPIFCVLLFGFSRQHVHLSISMSAIKMLKMQMDYLQSIRDYMFADTLYQLSKPEKDAQKSLCHLFRPKKRRYLFTYTTPRSDECRSGTHTSQFTNAPVPDTQSNFEIYVVRLFYCGYLDLATQFPANLVHY